METIDQQKKGKSRLPQEQLDRMREFHKEDEVVVTQPKSRQSLAKLGMSAVVVFVLIVIVSVVFRVLTQKPAVIQVDNGEEIALEEFDGEEIPENYDVDINAVEIAWEEPERIYHIEKRQQFCAEDIAQARKLYSEYIGTKNRQVMEIKPRTISEEQWMKEKRLQGAYRDNLGERERNYYYEYPTTAGPYVDLMRIHKCKIFNPGGRIIPILNVSEDGLIPPYEMGIMGLEETTQEDMVEYIQYLVKLDQDEDKIISMKRKTLGDYLTVTLELEYEGVTDWVKVRRQQEVYHQAQYKLNLESGMLKYSEDLLVRDKPEELES